MGVAPAERWDIKPCEQKAPTVRTPEVGGGVSLGRWCKKGKLCVSPSNGGYGVLFLDGWQIQMFHIPFFYFLFSQKISARVCPDQSYSVSKDRPIRVGVVTANSKCDRCSLVTWHILTCFFNSYFDLWVKDYLIIITSWTNMWWLWINRMLHHVSTAASSSQWHFRSNPDPTAAKHLTKQQVEELQEYSARPSESLLDLFSGFNLWTVIPTPTCLLGHTCTHSYSLSLTWNLTSNRQW